MPMGVPDRAEPVGGGCGIGVEAAHDIRPKRDLGLAADRQRAARRGEGIGETEVFSRIQGAIEGAPSKENFSILGSGRRRADGPSIPGRLCLPKDNGLRNPVFYRLRKGRPRPSVGDAASSFLLMGKRDTGKIRDAWRTDRRALAPRHLPERKARGRMPARRPTPAARETRPRRHSTKHSRRLLGSYDRDP